MTPSERQIHDWCDQLRELTALEKGRTRTPLDKLESELVDAARRARTARPSRDGYPSGTLGGGGSSGMLIDDEEVPATSVEKAALTSTTAISEVDQNAMAALAYMASAIAQLNGCRSRLASLERRSDPTRPSPKASAPCAEKHCEETATKAGRCDACYLWRWREANRQGITLAEVGPVPKQVINARTGRIHVNPITGAELAS